MWPDVGLKSSRISTKGCSKTSHRSVYLKMMLSELSKKIQNILTTFERKNCHNVLFKNRPIWSHCRRLTNVTCTWKQYHRLAFEKSEREKEKKDNLLQTYHRYAGIKYICRFWKIWKFGNLKIVENSFVVTGTHLVPAPKDTKCYIQLFCYNQSLIISAYSW